MRKRLWQQFAREKEREEKKTTSFLSFLFFHLLFVLKQCYKFNTNICSRHTEIWGWRWWWCLKKNPKYFDNNFSFLFIRCLFIIPIIYILFFWLLMSIWLIIRASTDNYKTFIYDPQMDKLKIMDDTLGLVFNRY